MGLVASECLEDDLVGGPLLSVVGWDCADVAGGRWVSRYCSR